MASQDEILFNYTLAIRQAAALDALSDSLRNTVNNKMSGILNQVGVAWKSESSQQYMQKGEQVKEELLASARNISDIAQTIRKIAERVKAAEMEAVRIANEREA